MTATEPTSHREHHHHVRGGPPVLDIGGNIGALVATMDHDTAGTELHLRSQHQPSINIHTGVWLRSVNGATTTAAVFAELVEGTYWVLDPAGTDLRPVIIRGGELASIDLRRIPTADTTPIHADPEGPAAGRHRPANLFDGAGRADRRLATIAGVERIDDRNVGGQEGVQCLEWPRRNGGRPRCRQ